MDIPHSKWNLCIAQCVRVELTQVLIDIGCIGARRTKNHESRELTKIKVIKRIKEMVLFLSESLPLKHRSNVLQ